MASRSQRGACQPGRRRAGSGSVRRITVSEGKAGRSSRRVTFDGTNYVVVWHIEHNFPPGFEDIGGRRVSPSGALLGGFVINAPQNQETPAIAAGGKNTLVVWRDYRPGGGIYGTRVSDGKLLDPDGIPIMTGPGGAAPSVAFDGANYLVAWQDFRLGDRQPSSTAPAFPPAVPSSTQVGSRSRPPPTTRNCPPLPLTARTTWSPGRTPLGHRTNITGRASVWTAPRSTGKECRSRRAQRTRPLQPRLRDRRAAWRSRTCEWLRSTAASTGSSSASSTTACLRHRRRRLHRRRRHRHRRHRRHRRPRHRRRLRPAAAAAAAAASRCPVRCAEGGRPEASPGRTRIRARHCSSVASAVLAPGDGPRDRPEAEAGEEARTRQQGEPRRRRRYKAQRQRFARGGSKSGSETTEKAEMP